MSTVLYLLVTIPVPTPMRSRLVVVETNDFAYRNEFLIGDTILLYLYTSPLIDSV